MNLRFRANLFDKNGVLTIVFLNPNGTSLLFPLEDGMEVLYPEGGFALNFARGLGIIFCWMALLAALGLAAASFLSFPVATFFSLAMLVVGFIERNAWRMRWKTARSAWAAKKTAARDIRWRTWF